MPMSTDDLPMQGQINMPNQSSEHICLLQDFFLLKSHKSSQTVDYLFSLKLMEVNGMTS